MKLVDGERESRKGGNFDSESQTMSIVKLGQQRKVSNWTLFQKKKEFNWTQNNFDSDSLTKSDKLEINLGFEV